ncbi:MAG: hypothetical protein EON86_19575, partial [Brevundimonas sp.]
MKRLITQTSVLAALLALTGCDLPGLSPAATAPLTAEACVLPSVLPAPHMETVGADEVVADRPILFHMLAVTWMPETCRNGGDGQGDLACSGPNKFGWTLHGL